MVMHVVEPARYQAHPKPRRWWPFVAIPLGLVLIAGVVNFLRPLPTPTVAMHITTPATVAPTIAWPAAGQAAIAAGQYGLLDTTASQTPVATASIAKVITALCVLQKAPLALGQSGPTYTIGQPEVDIYNTYVAEDGSLIPVQQGEQITEYQALEALMIPSANNIADSLAHWVFGSQAAYATYASEFLQQNGLDNTHIGSDASGFDPSTTSTAGDLAQLGLLALKNPALMQIAGQSSAELPVAGKVSNYDTVLGQNGISGLKTGNNTTDLGAFLFTATTNIGSTTIPLTGAVMGAPDLNTALQESVQLAGSLEHGFEQASIATADQTVGTMQAGWGASAPIDTASAVKLIRWEATPITAKHQVDVRLRSGTVGTLKATAGPSSSQTDLKLGRPLPGPSFWWRLSRR